MSEIATEPVVVQPSQTEPSPAATAGQSPIEKGFGENSPQIPTGTLPTEPVLTHDPPPAPSTTPAATTQPTEPANVVPGEPAKTDTLPATPPTEPAPLTEFTLDHLKGGKSFEENSWGKFIKDNGLEVPADFKEEAGPEFYHKAMEQKYAAEVEKARVASIDQVLSTVSPETAAMIKLIEMGVPQDKLFAPTQELDIFIAMADAPLVRENLKVILEQRGVPQAEIEGQLDNEMEKISADPNKLKVEADGIRYGLKHTKTQILNERTQLAQQFDRKKQEAALAIQQKDQISFKETLNTASKFMGVPLTQEVKDVIAEKYSKGEYSDALNNPQSKVDLILFKEFGEAYISSIKNTALEKGRDDKTRTLLNIPPVQPQAGQRVVQNPNQERLSPIDRDFGR